MLSSSIALCTRWSILDGLINEGIYEPIAHSNWETPIVPAIKPDDSIRICGDYKQTINRASDSDKYPIPMNRRFIRFVRWGWEIYKTWFKSCISAIGFKPRKLFSSCY